MQRLVLLRCTRRSSLKLLPLQRFQSTRTNPRFRVGHVFGVLAFCGISATSYGLYLFYNSFMTWPVSVRQPLRSALRARQLGDIKGSEAFFRKALREALELPPSDLGEDRLLKITGVQIALAGLLEGEGRLGESLAILEDALALVTVPDPSLKEQQRAIALSSKIGQLATTFSEPEMLSKAEERLSWSVTQLLKLASTPDQRKAAAERTEKGETGLNMDELDLPSWTSKTDLGASMENLGAFYLSQGKGE
jgi:hypothetical protein